MAEQLFTLTISSKVSMVFNLMYVYNVSRPNFLMHLGDKLQEFANIRWQY